jgi:hypothetical protein
VRQEEHWETFHDRVQDAKDHIEKHYGSYDSANDNGFKKNKTLAQNETAAADPTYKERQDAAW